MRLHKGVVRVIIEPNLWGKLKAFPLIIIITKATTMQPGILQRQEKISIQLLALNIFIKICRFLNYFVLTESLLAMAVLQTLVILDVSLLRCQRHLIPVFINSANWQYGLVWNNVELFFCKYSPSLARLLLCFCCCCVFVCLFFQIEKGDVNMVSSSLVQQLEALFSTHIGRQQVKCVQRRE